MTRPAIVIFTTAASATAGRIASVTGGRVHACGPSGEGAGELLPRLYREGHPIIGICAAGILMRILAPHLKDKHAEPPVIAVSTDGRHVVPILGGHRGANRMAAEIADALGGIAAITTASDSRFARALDEPPPGYVLADPEAAKPAMAALLGGEAIRLDGEADWLTEAGYPLAKDGSVRVRITTAPAKPGTLTYHPKSLVAGIGCERGVEANEVIKLLDQVLAGAKRTPNALAAIASIDIKSDETALHAAAAHFGVPLRFFSPDELKEETPRLKNPSRTVEAEIGVPGVAEACALKAGELLVEKRKSKRATCAIGIAPAPLDTETFGRPPGVLHVVGIGPGDAASRTASAINALGTATDWVGYGLYLDLIADLREGQTEHRFNLGDEEVRVRHALELAGEGRQVALVCSGDAQIYAMAALVYELLDAAGSRAVSDAARRVAVECHPGISALQAASARSGALLGHDFCAISLSDLLTPREAILNRLDAAAKGDFVTALYNPRSKRRIDLLDRAVEIFRAHRPPETPVIIASSLGRPEEKVRVVQLSDFDTSEVDMMTIVLVGSSQSRAFVRGDGETRAFTPRGYEHKSGKAAAE